MTSQDHTATEDHSRLAMYHDMQRSIPGLDAMYRLMLAHIAGRTAKTDDILIVGAGGGREIGELDEGGYHARLTALDVSRRNLETARHVAQRAKTLRNITFYEGSVADLPGGETFDVATSLLVMHAIPDTCAKLAYLKSIHARLRSGGELIHADVCFDSAQEYERMVPTYLAHAQRAGIPMDATRLEREAISQLAVISGERTTDLFVEAGFTAPREVFRSLWYRCWVAGLREQSQRSPS